MEKLLRATEEKVLKKKFLNLFTGMEELKYHDETALELTGAFCLQGIKATLLISVAKKG